MKLAPWTLPLLLLTVLGCSSLIVREDDSVAEKTGKVVTRALLVLPTFLMSEAAIAQAKRDEQQALEQARYADWFHSLSPELQERERDRQAYQRAAAMQALGLGLMGGGLRWQSPGPRYNPPANAPMTCSNMPTGTGVTTVCR